LVHTTEIDDTSDWVVRVSVQPETEQILFEQAVFVTELKWWKHIVDSNGLVGKTENTVEFSGDESDTRFLGGFAKSGLRYGNAAEADGIDTVEAPELAGSVSQEKFGFIVLPGGRF
jgi:hypothetical protein